ncbi:MAG: 2-oxoglutaramate amidase [Candidatus Heimdallarchaeota archaeon LC_3]|nr:MAG: 2-oxoglutaramate amidase [Candidatus Heimdallarchaeota archaeon LC_3]
MKILLNLVQFDIKTNDPIHNIDRINKLLENVSFEKNDQKYKQIIIVPELFTTGFGNFVEIKNCAIDFSNLNNLALEQTEHLKNLANKYNALILGSIPELKNKSLYNSCIRISTDSIEVVYRKMHLFGPMDEPEFFTNGNTLLNFEYSSLNIGTQICYDLRFPEAARKLSADGASIIFYTADWPSKRGNHWNHLLKARAIENQCFVIGVNRVGSDKWGEYFGRSQIISPMGEILGSLKQEESCLTKMIDVTKEIESSRLKFNVHKDRRITLET